MKIIIIEDDARIANMVTMTLQIRWPKAVIIHTKHGKEGVDLIANENPRLIVLDLGLPDIDGLDVLKQIKGFTDAPVLILSVRSDEADIVEGLELGAEEYITKPFRQLEFLSRVQCILRRNRGMDDNAPTIIGEFNFQPAKRRLIIQNREILLTITESRIIEALVKQKRGVVSIPSLADAIWGADYPGSTEAIHVYIRRLRQKIEANPSNPQLIITLPGSGYSLQIPE